MIGSDDLIHGRDIGVPCFPFVLQMRAALRSQMIVAASRTARAFDPASFYQTFFFEPAEHRIQRSDPEMQFAAGPLFDELSDFITVAVAILEQRQNEKLRTAFLELAVEHESILFF